MRNLDYLDWIAIILLIIGGLNWGLIGAFNYNLVEQIFSFGFIARLIYVLVGLSAIYLAVISVNLIKRQ